MIKTQKTRIATLLLVLVTLFTALFIPLNAAEPDTSEDVGIEEIAPRVAARCPVYHIYALDDTFNIDYSRQPLTLEEAMVEVAFGGSVWVDGGKSYAEYVAMNINNYVYHDAHTSYNGQNQFNHFSVEGGGHVCFGDPVR